MANPPERSGPGQSGYAAGQQYFDERAPGVMPYPVEHAHTTLAPSSNDELREMVVAALRDDAPGIAIEVAGGVVTLSGAIVDDVAKRRIEAAARGVPGVKAIVDRLGAPPVGVTR
jgi:hypothetical protein